MKTFDFKGEVKSSKSYFNRALILSHYKKNLQIKGDTQSQDVLFLQKALQNLTSEIEVGEGGTTLRFLTFLVSRIPGRWTLRGSPRLFSRPQKEMQNILEQLGVRLRLSESSLAIDSEGWRPASVLRLDLSKSSQFASGLILNAWELPFEMKLELSQERVSDGYLAMTLDLVRKAGMVIQEENNQLIIPADQKIKIDSVEVEQDVSSAFVVASLAAGRGHCEIQNFPFQSLQPDILFVSLFKEMGIPLTKVGTTLQVERALHMKSLEISLRQAPDLFPVLCVLLTRTQGVSRIYDTPQLVHKESNRLQKISELLNLMRVENKIENDGIVIRSLGRHHHEFFEFDPDQDHRLAFAAALAKSFGYRMRIRHPKVVKKSFPQFWDLIGGGPG